MKPLILTIALAATLHAAPPEPKFRAVTIDDKIQIGYGVAVADVDGDKRPDILLADKKQIVWYQNPGQPPPGAASFAPSVWSKFVIAENLTEHDNVCLAAQDIDGDGKCEIAVGAEWNPGDTVNSGAVFYLIPPEDRTQKWEPVKFPNVEPTTHRMKWINLGRGQSVNPAPEKLSEAKSAVPAQDSRTDPAAWGLVVVPLHGRGNKNGEGAPVKVLLYQKSADGRGEWKSEIIDESMHMTHNFCKLTSLAYRKLNGEGGILIGGKEGLIPLHRVDARWQPVGPRADFPTETSVGEVAVGSLNLQDQFIATVEPMHGNSLVAYVPRHPSKNPAQVIRQVLTEKLTEGHALRSDDILGTGSDQFVVGWRGTPGKEGSTIGVHVWTPLDEKGEQWRDSAVDDGGMACEDLVLADLNGDGKLDIIASGRATHNVKVYFNETPR